MPRLNATALVHVLMWTSVSLFALALMLAGVFPGEAQGWATLFGRLGAGMALTAGGVFLLARAAQAREQARVRVRVRD